VQLRVPIGKPTVVLYAPLATEEQPTPEARAAVLEHTASNTGTTTDTSNTRNASTNAVTNTRALTLTGARRRACGS
jgi:hypothetical protein